MKQFFVRATVLASLLAANVIAGRLEAQQPGMAAAPTVAIIDIPYIFNRHIRFQQLKEDMRREVEAAEQQLVADRNALQQLAQRLEGYKKGSPEYAQLEEDVARRQADMNIQTGVQRKKFLEQEAKIYYSVYQEVLAQVKYHAEATGIQLVIRFNGDPIDQADPQEILKLLNQTVVYNSPAIDITPVILDKVNGGRPAPAHDRAG